MKVFYYQNLGIIIQLKDLQNPTKDDLCKLLQIIEEEKELIKAFYRDNHNDKWLDILRKAGQFDKVPQAIREGDGVSYRAWPQSEYLANVAGKRPEEVLEIIQDFDTDNIYVIRDCVRALGAMPAEIAIQGMGLIKRLFEKDIYHDWFYIGEEAAKLMVGFAKKGFLEKTAKNEFMEQAFEIARMLLEVEPEESKYNIAWYNLRGRFGDDEYHELVFKYYKTLWELDGIKAGILLIYLLDENIERAEKLKEESEEYQELLNKTAKRLEKFRKGTGTTEKNEEKREYDPTSTSYILMPKIETAEQEREEIANILVGGISAIGVYLMEKNPDQAEELIGYLESKRKAIFERIKIYILGRAPVEEKWKERIAKVVTDQKYYEGSLFINEFYHLLNSQKDQIGEEKKVFLNWVEKQGLADAEEEKFYKEWYEREYKRPATKEDMEKYIQGRRAALLLPVKEVFPNEYKEHQEKSQKSEEELAPRERQSFRRAPEAEEESSVNENELLEMGCERALEYIKNPDHWKEPIKQHPWRGPKEALALVLQNVVRRQVTEYIKAETEKLNEIDPDFLSKYFTAIQQAIKNKEVEKPDWKKILEKCIYFAQGKNKEEPYKEPLKSILSIIEDSLDDKVNPMEPSQENLLMGWATAKSLIKYPYNPNISLSDKEDPLTECINCVQGKAFQLAVRLAIKSKNIHGEKFYKENLHKESVEIYEYVAKEVKEPKINCVFGVWFPQLCWLNEEWIKDDLSIVFDRKNSEIWDAVWGSYVSWSRPTKQSFEIAKEEYNYAIESIGEKDSRRGRKDKNKGLVEHIMMGFWQGWVDYEEGSLLRRMLEKANSELRAEAARFLSSGFEYLKENPDDERRGEIVEKLQKYWEARLEVLTKQPDEDKAELLEFMSWVKDAPFEPGITFNSLERTLDLTGGEMGKRRSGRGFLEGVSNIAEGYELRALRLLNRVINQEEPPIEFIYYIDVLEKFMGSIPELPKDHKDIKEIREEAIRLADSLGRMGSDKYKGVYDALTKQDRS